MILGKDSTQGIDDTTLTAAAHYSSSSNEQGKRFCISLHDNVSYYLFVNATKIYQFKAKDSEITAYPLCFGNTYKRFFS